MPEQPLQILLVEDNPGDAELVRQMLLEAELPFVLCRAASLVQGLDLVIEKQPDVILLDLSLPDSSGLETFKAVHAHASGVPIVVLTGMHDESMALAAVEAGAQDYLVKDGLDHRILAKAVRYAVIRQTKTAEAPGGDRPPALGKIIGVLGGKAGVGATAFASYLSIELRRAAGQPVLLADLDMRGGMIDFFMQAPSSYSILDATTNIHRLDQTFWRSMVATGAGGVEVMRAADPLGLEEPPSPAAARHVLHFVRSHYPWVVADLGHWSAWSMDLLKEVTELCVVTTAELAALYKTKRVVQHLLQTGFERAHAHLVLNRMPSWCSLTPAELERLVDLPDRVVLPDVSQDQEAARAAGDLLAPNTVFRRRITGLAEKLLGIDGKKVKRPLLPLFGRGK